MKILLAADGSSYTKKALAFLVTHPELAGQVDNLVVIHVQPRVPGGVKSMVGSAAVDDYHRDEARKVLAPIERFLKRHDFRFSTTWSVGVPAETIVKAAKREKADSWPTISAISKSGTAVSTKFFISIVLSGVIFLSPKK